MTKAKTVSKNGKPMGRPPGAKNKKKDPETKPPEPVKPTGPEQPAPSESIDDVIKRMRAEHATIDTPPAQEPAASTEGAEKPKEDAPNAPPTPPAAAMQEALPFKISGYLALVVVDAVFPAGIAFFLNRQGWDIDSDDLKMTDKEREQLEPVADECAKQLIANPWVLLAISVSAIYMGKIPPRPKKAQANGTKEERQKAGQGTR